MSRINILELDIASLFRQYTVQELLQIERKIEAEIENKRVELRSMVGDRYKDILTATEAIKSIEHISENIVDNIDSILTQCDSLVSVSNLEVNAENSKCPPLDKDVIEERRILIQIRLAIDLNEHIWLAIDEDDYCEASQIYLLTQYVHTGLRLMGKDTLQKYRIIKRLKSTVDMLRNKIIKGSNEKLKNVELSTEETCRNLNAILLLESYTYSELLKKFINLRKNALDTVISKSHPSVRTQISSMIKCLYITIQLLHDCFLNYNLTSEGLIWRELNKIVNTDAPQTLTKVKLYESKLTSYIPEVIRQFRPKTSNSTETLSKSQTIEIFGDWLEDTCAIVQKGVQTALELVSNIKGLHLIREEALKIECPKNFDEISSLLNLPHHFNVWYYFVQDSITKHAQYLISKKISLGIEVVQEEFLVILKNSRKNNRETDLRWYMNQTNQDELLSSKETKSLSMKTKGYSPNIVKLCECFDGKFRELLIDLSMYIFGKEYDGKDFAANVFTTNDSKKYVDRQVLTAHLKQECVGNLNRLSAFLEKIVSSSNEDDKITKSIISARFLNGITQLCTNFKQCCVCDNSLHDWDALCTDLNKSSLKFWDNWIDDCCLSLEKKCQNLNTQINPQKMLTILCRWDTIEIQEQTEEKTFKSQIKLPMKCSMILTDILDALTDMLNAVLPHTLHKRTHSKFIERSTLIIFGAYENLLVDLEQNGGQLNQMQALQFLFDVKFLATICVPKENMTLLQKSQQVSNKFRSFIDPFDLDVFYKYLQHNVRQSALQSQVILGCLLPSSSQLAALGQLEKNKEHEKEPSILGVSVPSNNNWFLLLPVSEPSNKSSHLQLVQQQPLGNILNKSKSKSSSSSSGVRSGAAALFGAMTTDWFS